MRQFSLLSALLFPLVTFTACSQTRWTESAISSTGIIRNTALIEASGLLAARRSPGVYFLHNDDGVPQVFAINEAGEDLGSFLIDGASNRDWEDISWAPGDHGPLLVIADTGDNFTQHDQVLLYFVAEPQPGSDGLFSGTVPLVHTLRLTYPDGARDCESVAYEPSSQQIIFISKRDKPARIYSIALGDALATDEAVLDYQGDVYVFRPPSASDMVYFGERDGPWVSQPTGLDFNPSGNQAAIISYRSVYLFNRARNQTWPQAFAQKPREILGPESKKEEAIGYTTDGKRIMVTTEGIDAPVYRLKAGANTN